MKSYVKFIDLIKTGKTRRVAVNAKDGGALGVIAYYPQWRRFTFQPFPNTIYDSGCLQQINAIVEALYRDYKGVCTLPQQLI